MKVYLSVKVEEKINKVHYALTTYSNTGDALETLKTTENLDSKKYNNHIKGMLWAIQELKNQSYKKRIAKENIMLFINSKTLYKWLENHNIPEGYYGLFSELEEEMSYFPNELTIVNFKDTESKVINSLYKESLEEDDVVPNEKTTNLLKEWV